MYGFSTKFDNCVFHDNSNQGIFVSRSTIHLHGGATAIHSNEQHGICAYSSAKVIIHLPSHHSTSYNNKGEDLNNGAQTMLVIHL